MKAPSRSRVLALAIAVLALTGGPRRAHAEEDPEALIRQGNQLRARGDNARAHGYFMRAYEVAHTGRTAAQLGLVELALGHYLEAERYLSEALGTADAWVEKNRDALRESRDKARNSLGRVEVHGVVAGTTVEISGRAPVAVPPDGTIWVAPGHTTLRFVLGSRGAVSKEATVSPGASISLDIEVPAAAVAAKPAETALAPSPASPPVPDLRATATPPETAGHAGQRIAGIVTAGAGVALGVTGFIVYRAGASKLDAINADAAANRPYNASNGDYQSLGATGVGLMVAGGAAVATGAVLYLLGHDTGREPAQTSVSVGWSPRSGGAIQLAGSFP